MNLAEAQQADSDIWQAIHVLHELLKLYHEDIQEAQEAINRLTTFAKGLKPLFKNLDDRIMALEAKLKELTPRVGIVENRLDCVEANVSLRDNMDCLDPSRD